eukprot:g13233.t1
MAMKNNGLQLKSRVISSSQVSNFTAVAVEQHNATYAGRPAEKTSQQWTKICINDGSGGKGQPRSVPTATDTGKSMQNGKAAPGSNSTLQKPGYQQSTSAKPGVQATAAVGGAAVATVVAATTMGNVDEEDDMESYWEEEEEEEGDFEDMECNLSCGSSHHRRRLRRQRIRRSDNDDPFLQFIDRWSTNGGLLLGSAIAIALGIGLEKFFELFMDWTKAGMAEIMIRRLSELTDEEIDALCEEVGIENEDVSTALQGDDKIKALSKKEQILELFRTTEMKSSMDLLGCQRAKEQYKQSQTHVVSEITPWLCLGGALQDGAWQLEKTTHGICAALERNVSPVMKKLEHLLILNLEDKGSEAECLTAFKIAVAFAQKALEEPECKIYVFCALGCNRSAIIVMALLMAVEGLTLDVALKLVREKRPAIRPKYMREKSLLSSLVSFLPLDRHLLCCNVQHEQSVSGEMKVVELTSDADVRLANPVHLLTEHDSFDVTVSPRAGAMGEWTKHLSMTPRQHDFRDRIQLPRLLRYPLPPDCLADEPEEKRRATLLKVFQDLSVSTTSREMFWT